MPFEYDSDDGKRKQYRKNRMRGRKDKYYRQVDNEDMIFADDDDDGIDDFLEE